MYQYRRTLRFPDIIEARIRVSKTGNTNIRYEIGLFTKGVEEPAALGYFVRVFVDRSDVLWVLTGYILYKIFAEYLLRLSACVAMRALPN